MEILLSPELTKFVEDQVATGAYAGASDVVLAGLELLQERIRDRHGRLEELKHDIAGVIEELDRGESYSLEEVVEELRQRNRDAVRTAE